MSTTAISPSKAHELGAVAALAEQLGPNSYLGPWLRDALPWLADQIHRDYLPQHAREMAEEAARVKAAAYSAADTIRQEAADRARQTIEAAAEQAQRIKREAEADADRIRGTAWQALRQDTRALEA